MQHPVFRRFWYPTLPVEALADGPRAFTLLEQELVLWLQADGNPAALQDRCPHRAAKLSVDSKVVDGAVACGYHGWQFNGAGACTFVPQMPDFKPSRRSTVTAFACQARYGYVWVCLADNPLLDVPDLRYSDDPGFRQVMEYSEEWDANFLRVTENALDLGHISFVHRATIGDDAKPVAPRLEVTPIPHGMRVRCDVPVANPVDQQKNLGIADTETVRQIEITWLMPSTFVLHFTYPNGLVHQICGFATPIDNHRCRRMQFVYRSDAEADAPAASVAAFDHAVAVEDRRILESCPGDFPLDPHAEAHMTLDRPSLLMKQTLRALLHDVDPNLSLADHGLGVANVVQMEAT